MVYAVCRSEKYDEIGNSYKAYVTAMQTPCTVSIHRSNQVTAILMYDGTRIEIEYGKCAI